MTKPVEQDPVTSERLERALVLLAYFIELDGDVHLEMYEKFEAELAELNTKQALKYRARQRLQSCLNEGGGESNPLKELALQFEKAPYRISACRCYAP